MLHGGGDGRGGAAVGKGVVMVADVEWGWQWFCPLKAAELDFFDE